MAKRIKKQATPNLEQVLTPKLLGEAIKARRTQSNLRQEDAAALCGVAKQTFMQVEHGYSSNQLDTVLQICSALGIKLSILPWHEENEVDNDWK
jgi:transcriptional regulator with XRE-family HTH domain